jgi:CHAT domain-containing protein/tetratricopeptide (TPR) repeat protein
MQHYSLSHSLLVRLLVAISLSFCFVTIVHSQSSPEISEDAELYRNIVRAIGNKNYGQAIELGRRLIERTDKYERVYVRIVEAAKYAGQLEQTKRLFESLLQKPMPNPRGYYGLGLICKEQKDYASAIEHYKNCLNAQPDFPLPLLALVDAYHAEEKLEEAQTFIESLVQARLNDPVAHLGLGYCFARKGQTDAAAQEFDRALSLNPKMADACYYKANAFTQARRRRESLDAIAKCFPAIEKDINEEYLQAFLNISVAHNVDLMNYAEAVKQIHQALGLANIMGDKSYEEVSIGYLARAYELQGAYSLALATWRRAFEIAKDIDDVINLRRYPRYIGNINYLLGDLPAALQEFQTGLEMAITANDGEMQAAYLSQLGEVFVAMNQPDQAIAYFNRLTEIKGKPSKPPFQLFLLDLTSPFYLKIGEYQKAQETIQQALKLARELSDAEREMRALNYLGELHGLLNDYGQAINAYREALRLAHDRNNPLHAWTACAGLALAYERLGQFDDAREYYRQAIKTMERVRAGLGVEEEKAGFFQDKVKVYKGLIAVLLHMHSKDANPRYDVEAFQVAEGARARALLDLLGEAKNVDQTIDPDLLKRQQEIQTSVSKLNAQLINERSKEPAKQGEAKIKELEEALNKTDEDLADWLRELRRRNRRYADLKYPEPLKLEQAQRMLNDHSLVLAYSLGERESFLFAVSRDGYRVAKLPPSSDIGKSVETLIAAITDRTGASLEKYRAQAVELYKELIQPAGDLLAGKRELIIIADDALHRLPFETLICPSPVAVRSDYSKWPYLIGQFAVSYAPSMSALASLPDYHKETGAPQKAFVAYADPNYDQQNTPIIAAVVRSAGDGQQLKLGRLLNSRDEVEGIAKLFAKDEADLYLEDSASEENVKSKDRLRQYRIVHFSAHGLVNEKRPRFSGIVLSLPKVDKEGKPLSEEDGVLSAYEILNLTLNADLVVLSACQTGTGKEIKGEGMMGLMRAFMYAGTPSVVVSLWNVNDRSAADLMIRFYKHLWKPGSEKLNKAEALRKAQLELIDRGSKPYHWAPFILVGKS